MLRDQVFDKANSFQARARPQGVSDFCGFDACYFRQGGIGFRRIFDLEFHQQAAQVALIPCQRAVQQQSPLCATEHQQAGQGIDVFLDQRALLFEGVVQPLSCHSQNRKKILGQVFGVFVQVKEQGTFFIRTAPYTMALHELLHVEGFMASPELIVFAPPTQEFTQSCEHGQGPHQMLAR